MGEAEYGLIFDVDGVIADTEAVNAAASIRMFEELFDLRGVERADFELGLGRGAAEYVRSAARVHNLELSEDDVARATERRQDNFLAMLREDPLPPFPGVAELITAARADERLSVAIATSSTREKSQAVLMSAGIPFAEMVYVNGSDVKRKKPDPELFVLACQGLGLEGSRCLVIEDAPNGIEAAQGAECKAIGVTNSLPREKLREADAVVDSVAEIDVARVIAWIDG